MGNKKYTAEQKALWATPAYKAYDEACKAEDEALDALMATPEWKAFREI